MESISGRLPLLASLTRGPTRADRDGFLGGLAVLGALIAVDAIFGNGSAVVGAFVLAPFVPAVLGAVTATVAIGLLTLAAALGSPAWNMDFAHTAYWVRIGEVALGAGFAVIAARARRHAQVNSQRLVTLDAVAAIADGSLPLAETLERVVDMIVPAAADMCMIDAIRDGHVVRAAVRAKGHPVAGEIEEGLRHREPSIPRRFVAGERAWMDIAHYRRRMDTEDLRRMATGPEDLAFLETLRPRSWIVASLNARGRSLGTLTLVTAWSGRRYTKDDVRFGQVLSRRIGMALDNAGLFSDLESIERRLDAVVSLLDEAVVVSDSNGGLVFANEAAARWLAYPSPEALVAAPREEILGRLRVWSEDGARLDPEAIARGLREGRRANRELFRIGLPEDEELWAMVNSEGIEGPGGGALYTVTTVEDVTELKRSEFAQQLLGRTGELLEASNDYRGTLEAATRVAVPGFAALCSVHLPREDGIWERVAIAHGAPENVVAADRLVRSDALEDASRTSRRARIVREEGVGSAIVAPMKAGSEIVGVLSFVNGSGARAFDHRDLAIATEIARRTGLALENSRLAGEQAEVAQVLQRGLLPPRPPAMDGFEVATMYRPAGEVNEVGGDFYDAFEIDGGWMVTIGDVMGRGAAAASLTALARYTIRTAGKLTGDLSRAARLVDQGLKQGPEISLCSAVILVLPDSEEDPVRIRLLVAGHPPPLLVRAGKVEPVDVSGPLLGAPGEPHWEIGTVELAVGDQLVLFTDGVTEARGTLDRFGDQRLRSALSSAKGPEEVVASVESALDGFLAGAPQDDAAILAVRRSARGSDEAETPESAESEPVRAPG